MSDKVFTSRADQREKATEAARKALDAISTTPADKTTGDPIKIYNRTLPLPMELSSVWNKKAELAPELISGVLREKHKMILTASSKAGKTFAMLELALAVATGGKWLGFQCKPGKTLYINFELAAESCFSRFQKLGAALKIKPQQVSKILVWNLRGYAVPFEELAPRIADLVKSGNIDLVILDPIYKVFHGSENEQEAVTQFCNCLDLIAEAGASVVYTHHHSKGAQGQKDPMDRGSGSGVFARDADALLDMTEIFLANGVPIDPKDHTVSAWQLEGVLREFAPFQPKKIYFRYPLHEVCEDGTLDDAKPRTANQRGGNTRGAQREAEAITNYKRFMTAYEEMSADGQPVKIKDLAEQLGLSDKTVRRYAAQNGGFVVSEGRLSKDTDKGT